MGYTASVAYNTANAMMGVFALSIARTAREKGEGPLQFCIPPVGISEIVFGFGF